MKIYIPWLEKYFDKPLPKGNVLADALSRHVLETEYSEEENMLDVDVLPHRSADCLSHYGVALEISAILNIPVSENMFSSDKVLNKHGKRVFVSVDDPTISPRFLAMRVKHIDNTVSIPLWMKDSLSALGQRSITPVVDITNYVMFELGHPLHAFDVAHLSKKENGDVGIGVRRSGVNDVVTLLDGKMLTAPEGIPLIFDAVSNQILGLAGVKGGKHALVTDRSTEIVIECAHFKRDVVYKSARSVGIHTDASYRFERNLSTHSIPYVVHRVATLLSEITGGEVCGVDEVNTTNHNRYIVPIDLDTISRVSGMRAKKHEVESIFSRLGFEYTRTDDIREEVSAEALSHIGKPYVYGASVSKNAPDAFDCSSFINYCFLKHGILLPRISANIYHYAQKINKKDIQPGDLFFAENNDDAYNWYGTRGKEDFLYLPPQKPLKEPIGHMGMYIGNGIVVHAEGDTGANAVFEENLEDVLQRYANVRFGSVISDEKSGWFVPKNRYYAVRSPVQRTDICTPEDIIEEYVRIKGLTQFVSRAKPFDNTGSKKIDKKLWYHFALAKAFRDAGFHETITHTFGGVGDVHVIHPLNKNRTHVRNTLTLGLEVALEKNMEHVELFGKDSLCLYEIGSVFSKSGEKTMLGFVVGRKKTFQGAKDEAENIQRIIQSVCGVGVDISLSENIGFEIDFDDLVMRSHDVPPDTPYPSLDFSNTPYNPISVYPCVMRDIAVFVPKSVSSQRVAGYIERYGDDTLISYRLFDVFEKDDNVSYAFRLVFQSVDRTLTDTEVNVSMYEIESQMRKQKDWEIR